MKKLLLSMLLLAVTGTSFGMNNDEPKKSYWPYAKIGLGLGFAGLSAWLALRDSGTSSQYAINIDPCEAHVSSIFSPSIIIGDVARKSSYDVLRFFSPQLAISKNSLAALATFVPACFFMKSGFDDLRLEKQMLLERTKAK